MAVVNLAEVVCRHAKPGPARPDVEALPWSLPIRVVPADAALSFEVGMLRRVTLERGLPLGAGAARPWRDREMFPP